MRGFTALLVGAGFMLGACGSNGDDGSSETALRAQVRVVQAVVDAPTLDVFVTAVASLAAFPQLPSSTATGYVGLDQNSAYQFIARVPGNPQVLAQLDVSLAESQRVLLVVSGAITPAIGEQSINIVAYDDTRVDPGAGQTQLRVINATLTGENLAATVQAAALPVLGAAEETTIAVAANQPLAIAADAVAFTTPGLAPATDVSLLALGNRTAEQGDLRAFRFLLVPAVSAANTTTPAAVSPDPFAVIVNGVPGSAGALVVDGQALAAVPFGAVSPRVQVSIGVTLTLDGAPGSLSGALDPAATYLIVLAPDAESGGLAMFAYRDTIADAAETRIRAINTTVGTGSTDISFDPAPLLGNDLVFGAASPAAGTLVSDPSTVTAVIATPLVGGPFAYTTGIAATTRYVVLLGDTASDFGAAVIGADWSSTFVPGT